MSFVQRAISATIQLGTGNFGEGKANTVTISGLRASVQISNAGYPQGASCYYRVHGLPLSIMNTVLSLGAPFTQFRRNVISISAGDKGGRMSVIFNGLIFTAFPDFNQPDAVLTVQAMPGTIAQLKALPPLSFPGATDVATIMSGIATSMKLKFENHGVTGVMLRSAYFPGTGRDQAEACATAANITLVIDNDTLAIFPKGGMRKVAPIVLSPSTGLVGYPSWTAFRIRLTSIFNPTLLYLAPVKVESSIPAANGTFPINVLRHDLESETPGGAWFSEIECNAGTGPNPPPS